MSALSRVLYRLILLAFPRDVRRGFGREMEEMLGEHLQAAGSRRGRAGVWLAAAADAVQHGLGERVQRRTGRIRMITRPTIRWRWWMYAVLQDARYAVRMLVRQPGIAAVAVLTLALGIGANTAIFSAVNAVLLRPLPYPEPDRLMTLWETRAAEGVMDTVVSPADLLDWARMNTTFEHVAGHTVTLVDLTGAGDPVRLTAGAVSTSFFDVFGTRMLLGRTFRPEESTFGQHRVTVLSHPLWVERFGSNPAIVGQSVTLGGLAYEVIGVLPPEFDFPEDGDLWMPLSFNAAPPRTSHYLSVYGRLRDGVSFEQARADMSRIGSLLQQEHPDANRGHSANVIPMRERLQAPVRTSLWLLLAAVGFVLLIACANVASLLLARAATRTRELAVRAAIGAGRTRIVAQMLTESIVLALLGGAAGLLVAWWAIGALRRLTPANVSVVGLDHLGLEPRVLLFTLLLSVLTGLVFGVLPAANVASQDINANLKEGGRSPLGLRRALRSTLVVAEVALASLLLVAAGLTMRSFQEIMRADAGFATDGALTFNLSLPAARYRDPEAQLRLFRDVEARIAALPGVEVAGASSQLPLDGNDSRRGVSIEGREPTPDTPTRAHVRAITPNYLRAIGIRLKDGRGLSEQDTAAAPFVILVNETMARRYWPAEPSPVGKRLQLGGETDFRTVVGVVADVKFWGLTAPVNPEMYLPDGQYPVPYRSFVLRADNPAGLASAVREQVRQADPNLPVSGVRTLQDLAANSVAAQRSGMWLLAAFGALALTLAAAGIYGVMSHMVALRRAEIGIRITLGAEPRRVLRLILGEGAVQAGVGLAIGMSSAVVLMQIFRSVLYGVSPADPLTLALTSGVLFLVAVAACLVPARRAMRVDPIEALRR